MFLINGCEQNMLAASDRATQFGDGCFTTARIIDGEICLFAAHLARLQDACQKLLISFGDWSELQSEMKMLAQGHARGVLKVIISRGSGGRGYSGANCRSATRILCFSLARSLRSLATGGDNAGVKSSASGA